MKNFQFNEYSENNIIIFQKEISRKYDKWNKNFKQSILCWMHTMNIERAVLFTETNENVFFSLLSQVWLIQTENMK